jgi:hypothetical protein
MQDLNKLVAPDALAPELDIVYAVKINNRGQILLMACESAT